MYILIGVHPLKYTPNGLWICIHRIADTSIQRAGIVYISVQAVEQSQPFDAYCRSAMCDVYSVEQKQGRNGGRETEKNHAFCTLTHSWGDCVSVPHRFDVLRVCTRVGACECVCVSRCSRDCGTKY